MDKKKLKVIRSLVCGIKKRNQEVLFSRKPSQTLFELLYLFMITSDLRERISLLVQTKNYSRSLNTILKWFLLFGTAETSHREGKERSWWVNFAFRFFLAIPSAWNQGGESPICSHMAAQLTHKGLTLSCPICQSVSAEQSPIGTRYKHSSCFTLHCWL